MVTTRQLDALLGAFQCGSPWQAVGSGGRRFVRNHGGAYRRMVEQLGSDGFLYRKAGEAGEAGTATVKGLEALLDHFRKRKDAENVAKVEEALVVRRAAEEEVAAAKARALEERNQRDAAIRADRRVKWLAAFREHFREEAEGFRDVGLPELAGAVAELGERLTDEELVAFVDRIVSREMEL